MASYDQLVGKLYADLDPDVGRTLYRFTSAIAHGQDHGTAAMQEQTDDDRVVNVAAGVDSDDMLTFALTAFAGLRIATERVTEYSGWQTETWTREKDVAQGALIALVGAQERDIT